MAMLLSPANLRPIAGPLLLAGATTAVVFAAGLVSGHTLFGDLRPGAADRDSCGLPPGITADALDTRDLSYALRRGFLCADHLSGRIPGDQYRLRLALLDNAFPLSAAIAPDSEYDEGDESTISEEDSDIPTPASEPEIDDSAVDDSAVADSAPEDPDTRIVWASKVRGFSTQYTDSDWSAARALGAPDVPSGGGDDPNAWASESADDRVEFLEVGFDRPRHVRGVDIVETHNAGAVTRVDLIAADGTRTTAYAGRANPAATTPFRRRLSIPCSEKPIVAVRVTLDSANVPDWNEIDAIGVRPCTP
jgi:hypothetical protein